MDPCAVYGDPKMNNAANMFTAYQADYNWDRMEVFWKKGQLAYDMFIDNMGSPKKSKPIRTNWRGNKHLFWINDYTPKAGTTHLLNTHGYNREGPFKTRQKKAVKQYLNTLESKMVMPPGLNEPLLWDNIRLPRSKRRTAAENGKVVHRVRRVAEVGVKDFRDRFFQEIQPRSHAHFDIHPEFPSEADTDRFRTEYWQDGTIFTDPKKRGGNVKNARQLVNMPI